MPCSLDEARELPEGGILQGARGRELGRNGYIPCAGGFHGNAVGGGRRGGIARGAVTSAVWIVACLI